MALSVKEIIAELRASGHSVKAWKRPDGGWLIREIDGQKFKLAEGNKLARQIVGATLSPARSVQLASIKPEKGKTPQQRKLQQFDEETEKALRRAQRIWRKYRPDTKEGKPTKRKLRYTFTHYGKSEALRLLKSAEYYAKGIAYPENVDFLIQRLENISRSSENPQAWEEIISKIESMKGKTFTEDMLKKIGGGSGSVIYMLEEGVITEETAIQTILNIIQ